MDTVTVIWMTFFIFIYVACEGVQAKPKSHSNTTIGVSVPETIAVYYACITSKTIPCRPDMILVLAHSTPMALSPTSGFSSPSCCFLQPWLTSQPAVPLAAFQNPRLHPISNPSWLPWEHQAVCSCIIPRPSDQTPCCWLANSSLLDDGSWKSEVILPITTLY